MNNPALSLALATAPSSAFEALRERPKFSFPLLLLIAAAAITSYWYYSVVDVDWLKEVLYANDPAFTSLPADERAQAMKMIDRNTLLAGALVGGVLGVPIFLLLEALYFLMVAKVTKLSLRFRHWFALSCWTALPLLLSSVVTVIFLLTRESAQISPSVMQPLSINELLLQRPVGSPGYALFESLGIPSVLSIVLLVIGVRTWTQRSWAFSSIFVLLPFVVVYGIWSAVAFG